MARSTFSVCVFCGSRNGALQQYRDAAGALGSAIAQNGWRLVYGAGDAGLMGAVARSVQDGGGETFGVIPVHLQAREMAKRDLDQFVVTETMHERKKIMFMNCDALVVLPGGAGSLDEFFEVLTWRQLGLHQKPIFVLNTEGYWNRLVALLDHIIAQGFADGDIRSYLTVFDEVEPLVAALHGVQN